MLRVIEVLHAVSGMSLVVFPEEGLRAALPADQDLAGLGEDELEALRARAVPLTRTERLFELDGESWLLQQTGPAWADPSDTSADACGLLVTRMDGSQERHAVTGRPPGPPPAEDELRAILRSALAGDD